MNPDGALPLAGLQKRSITLAGHSTSLALEAEFWAALEAMAIAESISLARLIGRIDDDRGSRPLASACRIAALGFAQGAPSGQTDAEMSKFDIREDDLSGPETRALVALHLSGMHASSPPGTVFALDISGLTAPGVTFWSAWRDGRVAGMAALKTLGAQSGELKSMRTHPDFLRQGVAAALLRHVIAVARDRSLIRLSLETGEGEAFDAALALYRRFGFVEGTAFADYTDNGFSRFLHLDL